MASARESRFSAPSHCVQKRNGARLLATGPRRLTSMSTPRPAATGTCTRVTETQPYSGEDSFSLIDRIWGIFHTHKWAAFPRSVSPSPRRQAPPGFSPLAFLCVGSHSRLWRVAFPAEIPWVRASPNASGHGAGLQSHSFATTLDPVLPFIARKSTSRSPAPPETLGSLRVYVKSFLCNNLPVRYQNFSAARNAPI
jgi:hypothetical protein